MTTQPVSAKPAPVRPTRSLTRLTSRIVGVRPDAWDFRVSGPIVDLQTLIGAHAHTGTLVHATAIKPTSLLDGTVKLRLRSLSRSQAPTPYPAGFRPAAGRPMASTPGILVPSRPRYGRVAVIALAVSGTVAGILAAAAHLLGQLVELIASHAPLILGVLVLAAVIAALAARASGRRRHCPGC